MIFALLFVAFAYLLGSIPFAIVVSRAMRLSDPRTFGSRNPGATNVLRTGNKTAAALTLLGDALKGWAAVTLAIWATAAFNLPAITVGLCAVAVFLGHVFPVFLNFKGGKGVATALGVLIALNPWLCQSRNTPRWRRRPLRFPLTIRARRSMMCRNPWSVSLKTS